MKKLLILLTALLLPMVASADAVEIDGIYYNLVAKIKQAEVTSNSNKYSGEVVIPESVIYDGVNYSVTSIGNFAFSYCSDLTSVMIPNSVTTIGYQAFRECRGLTSVTISNSVTSIGGEAFRNCSGLTSVTIGNSVTSIESYAFQNCFCLHSVHISDLEAWCNISFGGSKSNPLCYAKHLYINGYEITNLVIPNSVTSIGNYAFYGCSGLTSITIPNSVKSIGDYAFGSCSGLNSVTIPNSVTSIGSGAFNSCTGLTSVTIPNSVTSIGRYAFDYCSGLTSVHISDLEAWCKIFFDVSSSNPLYYAHHLYMNGSEITNLVIPNSVTSIRYYAFYGCSGLTSVTIPNSVTSIGNYAFDGCSGLTSATIPTSVTSIGDYVFQDCIGLTSFTIPNSVTRIGYYAFDGCSGLKTVTIGTGIKTINNNSFANCQELADVYCHAKTVPNTASDAFDGSLIEYATLHVSEASIDLYKAATPWMNFKEIVAISEQQPVEENITFADANVKAICVSNWDTNGDGELSKTEAAAVTDIGTTFKQKTNITSFNELQYFTGLTEIGLEAFYSCQNLTSVIIPNNVVKIKQNAFLSCKNLVSISFPVNSGFEIEVYAFQSCTSLQSILFPKNLTTMNGSPFRNCPSLTEIGVDETNPNFKALDGVLYSKDGSKIVAYPCGQSATEYEIEEGTLTVGMNAFCGASKLEQIHIPNSVTQILNGAFNECSSLKTLVLPPNIVRIPNYMATGTGITEIVIPNKVTTIGSYAFENSNLHFVSIPASVTSINAYAFYNNSNLSIVKSDIETPFAIADNVFQSGTDFTSATLYVPIGTKSLYENTNGWSSFENIVEGEPVLQKEPYAVLSDGGKTVKFYYDTQKADRGGIDINNSFIAWDSNSPYGTATTAVFVASFADYRPVSTAYWFMRCSSLTNITGIENLNTSNVTNMYNMFYGCSGLKSLDVSHFNTENVTNMSGMFSGCSSLTSLDVSNFNTSNVTSMSNMFDACSGLTSFDVGGFNTSQVTYMVGMFQNCSDLMSLDLSGFDTSKVTKMICMFNGCSGLTSLDLSGFNTSKVTDLNGMFQSCSGLTSLDLSNFNTENVTNMDHMFYNSSALQTIYCNDSWSCESSTDMFKGCASLVGAICYDSSKTDVTYANPKTGYFTQKNLKLGDVNIDGSVSVTDVGCAINYILEQVPSVFIFKAADMNGDKSISVTDVGMIINLILNEGSAASPKLNRAAAENSHLAMQSTTGGYQLQLGNKDAFIGFQMDLQVANDATINGMKLIGGDDHLMTYRQLANGTWRVVCYSPTNNTFVANDAALLNIATNGNVTISNVRLTTVGLSEVCIDGISAGTTGITDVKGLQSEELKVYSLDGRLCRTIRVQQGENPLNGLKAGVYMIGNRKVVVR